MNRTNPEKWLCDDGKTLRAGDKKAGIWFNVENHEQADAIINMMSRFTLSQCVSMFRSR